MLIQGYLYAVSKRQRAALKPMLETPEEDPWTLPWSFYC